MEDPRVDVHFQGVFVRRPFSYEGGAHHLFTDHPFGGMDYKGCVKFLQRCLGEKIEKMYYCMPGKEFREGLRRISTELEYQHFVAVAYECGCEVHVFIDHVGVNVEAMIEEALQEDDEDPHDSHSIGSSFDDLESMTDLEDPCSPISKNKEEKKLPSKKRKRDHTSNQGDAEEEPDFVSREDDEPDNGQTFHTDEIEWKKQQPVLGMRFENPKSLKHLLCNYAVANGYQLCYKKNDSKRLLVRCCEGDCTFRLWASWMTEEQSFQIKSLKDEHNCARNFNLGPIVNYRWIGAHYKQEFLHKQKITVRELEEDVREKFGLNVSMGQCRRAKQHALSLVEGSIVEHYSRLWSYGAEIRRSNPGSNVKIEVNSMPDGTNYFARFYVCFDGLKRGWREGCRRVLNLDGCFLKGFCSGQLLAAVGRDANNHIFPVAWAVVCVENKDNWKWFLENVIDDLQLENGLGLTLMSDQHKGLLEVVRDVLPNAEHRQCARHILANFQKRFRGAPYEKLFWRACKATTENHFNAVMKELNRLNPAAHQHLMDRDPKTWSRAFFQTGRACDAFENGMAESFNSVIVSARHKPIITMLEEIRVWMMERVYHMSIKGQGWSMKICPAIKDLVDELKKEQRFWQVLPSGSNMFETRSLGASYAVDIAKKECTCRLWQLNGYGCVHSVATMSFLNKNIEAFVDPILLGNFYINTYKYPILPMNGSDMWPTTEFSPPLPPPKRRMPGRPQVRRRRGEEEGKPYKVSRAGKQVVCGNCKQPGHNKATCTYIPPNPVKLNVKRRKVALEHDQCSVVNKDAADDGDNIMEKLGTKPSGKKVQAPKTGKKRTGANVGSNKSQKRSKAFEQGETSGVNKDAAFDSEAQAEAAAIVAAFHAVQIQSGNEVQPQPQLDDHVEPQPVDQVQPQPQHVDEVQHHPLPVDEVQHQPPAVAEEHHQPQEVVHEVGPHPMGADQPHLQQKPLKRSSRIARLKLASRVTGKNGEGDSGAKPMMID